MIRFGKSVLGRAVRRGEQIMLPATSYVKPRNVQIPVLTGTGTVGALQSFTPGVWLDAASVTWAWFVGGIEMQQGGQYLPTPDDHGKSFWVMERATSSTGLQASARSAGVVIP